MNAEFAALESADFKKSINWESVFGDLGKQSLTTLQYNLDKIKAYFASNKDSMGATEIKDYQEAITQMEDEIASRNPFVALHKSIKDISTTKTEFVAALQAWHDAQDGITTAQQEYNDALAVEQALREQIDLGTLTADSEEYRDAEEKLKLAKFRVAEATERSTQAEQRALSARNSITVAYKNFATQLRSVGGVISGIGGQAQNLAAIFSDDVANSIGKVSRYYRRGIGCRIDGHGCNRRCRQRRCRGRRSHRRCNGTRRDGSSGGGRSCLYIDHRESIGHSRRYLGGFAGRNGYR